MADDPKKKKGAPASARDADKPGRAASAAEAPAAPAATPPPPAAPVDWTSWSRLWQVPAVVLSLVLIALGLRMASSQGSGNDFDGALQSVEQLLTDGKLDEAQQQLGKVIEPNLALATPSQAARFHACAADWVYLSQRSHPAEGRETHKRAADQYALAVQLGHALSALQTERWAESLLALNEIPGAQQRLSELEAFAAKAGDAGADGRLRRNRILRQLVERSLRQSNQSTDVLITLLADYRTDGLLAPADEAWAVARQAELRIEDGRAEQAVDRLLVDMRRIEPELTSEDGSAVGEMYTLLGRAYFALGRFDESKYHLTRALAQFSPSDPLRGEAMLLLGQLAMLEGRYEDAFEQFESVVRDYADTPSHLPGLLGRAEVLSFLGDHQRSLADYRQLRHLLAKSPPRRDVTAQRASQSLIDRHDSALALAKLELALRYIQPAEEFFTADQVPPDVLVRIASTSRQLADDIALRRFVPGSEPADGAAAGAPEVEAAPGIVQQAPAEPAAAGATPAELPPLDPALAHEAYLHYKRAADYYLRHSRSVAGAPEKDTAWSDSLWMSADSFDLAGWHDQAVEGFRAYLGGTPEGDPRRPEAMFRLAQALQAMADADIQAAIQTYEQIINEYPKSPYAARSHVPLAACYALSGRKTEAEQQLLSVLSGQRFLTPGAADYREAQLALGNLYYEGAEFAKAVEQLDAAVKRYPDDPRMTLTLFRLADSYRGRAMQIKQEADLPSTSRSERDLMLSERRQHLQTAAVMFEEVIDRFEVVGEKRLDRLQTDVLRYAHFYRGDCAFELGQYEKAVEIYDFAARKYAEHHSAMIALVQIVNCYHMLGDAERARTAHARALLRLEQLPPDTFDAPDALMNRTAWESWLRNNPIGQQQIASATP